MALQASVNKRDNTKVSTYTSNELTDPGNEGSNELLSVFGDGKTYLYFLMEKISWSCYKSSTEVFKQR